MVFIHHLSQWSTDHCAETSKHRKTQPNYVFPWFMWDMVTTNVWHIVYIVSFEQHLPFGLKWILMPVIKMCCKCTISPSTTTNSSVKKGQTLNILNKRQRILISHANKTIEKLECFIWADAYWKIFATELCCRKESEGMDGFDIIRG